MCGRESGETWRPPPPTNPENLTRFSSAQWGSVLGNFEGTFPVQNSSADRPTFLTTAWSTSIARCSVVFSLFPFDFQAPWFGEVVSHSTEVLPPISCWVWFCHSVIQSYNRAEAAAWAQHEARETVKPNAGAMQGDRKHFLVCFARDGRFITCECVLLSSTESFPGLYYRRDNTGLYPITKRGWCGGMEGQHHLEPHSEWSKASPAAACLSAARHGEVVSLPWAPVSSSVK